MKSKWYLVASIFQVVIGLLAVIAFFVIMESGENMKKWIAASLLSIYFIISGILGIVGYINQNSLILLLGVNIKNQHNIR